jgi:hypothetical protein
MKAHFKSAPFMEDLSQSVFGFRQHGQEPHFRSGNENSNFWEAMGGTNIFVSCFLARLLGTLSPRSRHLGKPVANVCPHLDGCPWAKSLWQ